MLLGASERHIFIVPIVYILCKIFRFKYSLCFRMESKRLFLHQNLFISCQNSSVLYYIFVVFFAYIKLVHFNRHRTHFAISFPTFLSSPTNLSASVPFNQTSTVLVIRNSSSIYAFRRRPIVVPSTHPLQNTTFPTIISLKCAEK